MPGAQVVAQDIQRREFVLGKVRAVVDARKRLPDLLVQRVVRLHGESPFRFHSRVRDDILRTRRGDLGDADRLRLGLGFRNINGSGFRFRRYVRHGFGLVIPGLTGNLFLLGFLPRQGLEAPRQEIEPQAREGQDGDGRDDEAHQVDASVHERRARTAAEAAAEQRIPTGQPAHEGQQPGADERAREGIDEPLAQGNPELGDGPAEGPDHQEGDEAERGEAEAPRDEETSPAEAQLGTGVGHGGFAAHQVRFGQQAGILFPGEEIRPHRDGGEEGEDTQQDGRDDPVFGPPLLVEFCPVGGGTFQFHFFLPFFL